jgi:LPXTG-site transpeptidase (sortase) family protein
MGVILSRSRFECGHVCFEIRVSDNRIFEANASGEGDLYKGEIMRTKIWACLNMIGEKKRRWARILPIFIFGLLFAWFILIAASQTSAASVLAASLDSPTPASRGDLIASPQADQDLSVKKSHGGVFQIGKEGVYTITVSNVMTNTIVTGVITVSDSLPASLTPPLGVTATGWSPCNFSGQILTCIYSNTLGVNPGVDLPPIVFRPTVKDTAGAFITNTASVSNTNDILNIANNVFSDVAAVDSADLSVSKQVTSSFPTEAGLITYTITITNNGPAGTTGVILTDTLPSQLTYVDSTPSQGTYDPASGRWSAGSLGNQQKAALLLKAAVNSGSSGKTIINTVSGLKSDLDDYMPGNNTASASFQVKSTQLTGIVSNRVTGDPVISASLVLTDSLSHVYTTTTGTSGWYTFTGTITNPLESGSYSITASKSGFQPKTILTDTLVANTTNLLDIGLDTAELVVSKTDGLTTITPGQTLTYTLTITNLGTITATHVVITDVLPTYLTYITDTLNITHSVPSTGNYVWTLNNGLGPNEGKVFKLRTTVSSALASAVTSLTNTFKAATTSPEANVSNNSVSDTDTSTGTPNISITKSVSPSEARTGQNFSFTIKVSNSGTAPVTNVTVNDSLSSYLDIRSATTTKGTATTNSSTRTVVVTIGTLNSNETVTITIIARVNNNATSTFTLTNTPYVTYTFAGSSQTKTASSVSFRVIGTTTLPGTGWQPLDPQEAHLQAMRFQQNSPSRPVLFMPALLGGVLLALLGLFALGYGWWSRSNKPEWSSWSMKMGLLFSIAALAFGLAAWGIGQAASSDKNLASLKTNSKSYGLTWKSHVLASALRVNGDIPDPNPQIIETLPNYPVPTPQLTPTPDRSGKKADISDITRIVIPAIGVDTVVKYVPFDGITWLIAGLHQEVAWMGDTSWPGLGSNTALAAHVTLRDGKAGPFYFLDKVEPGDTILLYTKENLYTYQVSEQRVVSDIDMSVVQATNQATLTLITCTGWDANLKFYLQRLVVSSELTGVKPLSFGTRGN